MRRRPGPRWIVAVAVLAAGAAAPAGPAGATTRLEVTPGYAGRYVAGRSAPVSVTLDADRLLHGMLEVTLVTGDASASTDSKVRVPVEVAGGSTKEMLVVAPPVTSFGSRDVAVTARLLDDKGRLLATSEARTMQDTAGVELVGLLPGRLSAGPAAPATSPLAVDAGVATFARLSTAALAAAPASLESLGTIAALPEDLAGLAPDAKRGLLRWLGDGGSLLVDAAPGTPLPELPPAWQPGAAGQGAAGLGRVRLTGGTMVAGRWAGLVEPTPLGAGIVDRSGMVTGPPESIGDSLALDAGLRLPDLGKLLGFLVVYIVAVGPVTAFVLGRRRRSELAWLVIPVVAVVFTSAGWAVGRGVRQNTRLAHATAVVGDAAGAWATTFVGVTERGGGAVDVAVPDAWSALPRPQPWLGFEGPGATVDITRQGPAARLDLGPGAFGVAAGTGPADPGSVPELTAAAADDGQVAGTIRNTTPWPLEDVTVSVGVSGADVGLLEPGESRAWALTIAPAGQVVGFDASMVQRGPGSPVNPALWREVVGSSAAARPTGTATAVGWTRQDRSVLVDGRRREAVGRTAVATTAPITPNGGRVTAPSVRTELVRYGASPTDNGRSVVRFTLPAGAAPTALVATLPAGQTEMWNGSAWVPLAPAGPVNLVAQPVPAKFGQFAPLGPLAAPGSMADYVLPAGAVHDGLVFVRIPVTGPPQAIPARLREATGG